MNLNTCGFSPRELARFRAWCQDRDITQSALIRALVRGILSGKIKAPLGRRVDSDSE